MDKIEALKKKLQEIVNTFNNLKQSGVNEEILVAYIQYKTKMSISNIKRMLTSQEDFYNNLIKQEILNKFEKEEKK